MYISVWQLAAAQLTQSLIESLTVKTTDRYYISVWQLAAAQFTQSLIESLTVRVNTLHRSVRQPAAAKLNSYRLRI